MARLGRYKQKVFASNAPADKLSEYGSLVADPPGNLYSGSTITPDIVQNLSTFLTGQTAAIVGTGLPALEDHNSLFYLYSYQLAYAFQAGVPEWDSGTTYYIGSLVQDGTGTLYNSKTDANLNNALTSGTNWQSPSLPGIITPNDVPYSSGMTLVSGQSMMWPHIQIGSSQTVVVPTGAHLIGVSAITVSGTGVLQATGTGTIRAV